MTGAVDLPPIVILNLFQDLSIILIYDLIIPDCKNTNIKLSQEINNHK